VLCRVALAILDRTGRWLAAAQAGGGHRLVAILVLPWFIAIVGRSGGAFRPGPSEGSAQQSIYGTGVHGAPPGYYLVLFWLTFRQARSSPRHPRRRYGQPGTSLATRFLLAWVVPAWVVFELVAPPPHYAAALSRIAILTAGAIDAVPSRASVGWRGARYGGSRPLIAELQVSWRLP
jgi:4-amino-4-deoxy-L-arabinose transferase-like glycosyltransferase